jgi:hypothetical protein
MYLNMSTGTSRPWWRSLRCLLAPGGRMLITVPSHLWLWGPHKVFLQHQRRYIAKSLRQALLKADLRVDRLSYFNTLLLPLATLAWVKDRLLRAKDLSGRPSPATSSSER